MKKVRLDPNLPVNEIEISKYAIRNPNDSEIAGLAKDIEQNGMLVPLAVRMIRHYSRSFSSDGSVVSEQYIVFHGIRRLLAAKMAGLRIVPAFLFDFRDDTEEIERIALCHLQQHELTLAEQVECVRRLLAQKGRWTEERVASYAGRSRTWVRARVQLMALTREQLESLGDVTIQAALELAKERIAQSEADASAASSGQPSERDDDIDDESPFGGAQIGNDREQEWGKRNADGVASEAMPNGNGCARNGQGNGSGGKNRARPDPAVLDERFALENRARNQFYDEVLLPNAASICATAKDNLEDDVRIRIEAMRKVLSADQEPLLDELLDAIALPLRIIAGWTWHKAGNGKPKASGPYDVSAEDLLCCSGEPDRLNAHDRIGRYMADGLVRFERLVAYLGYHPTIERVKAMCRAKKLDLNDSVSKQSVALLKRYGTDLGSRLAEHLERYGLGNQATKSSDPEDAAVE